MPNTLYTAKAHVTGGRADGHGTTDDGQLDVQLRLPSQMGGSGGGTNPEELNALLGTMSFWARLSPRQRDALVAENQALHRRLGRPIRSSAVACVVVARRQPGA